ncbi:MAG: GNAT family N-acetyltransferase [Rhizobiales bacterium]|nr:GNAT family N-acetyltransferase [Hyphomicrobiales bacterium]
MFPELTRDDVFRLETKRLWLRWPRAADVSTLAQLLSDPEVALWTARIPHPYSREAAEAFVLGARSANAEGLSLSLAIALRSRPQEAVGGIELRPDASGAARLGYWLGQPFRGVGYMAEAIEALISMTFGLTEVAAVEAEVMAVNAASLTVLKGLGFADLGERRIEAPARGGPIEARVMRLARRAFLPAGAAREPAARAAKLPSMSQQRRSPDETNAARALAIAADQ